VAFRPGLRLVTLNTAKESDSAKIVRQIDAAPQVRNADVILLQEVAHAPGHRGSVAQEIAAEFKMNVAYAPAAPGVSDQGIAILARNPWRMARSSTSVVTTCSGTAVPAWPLR